MNVFTCIYTILIILALNQLTSQTTIESQLITKLLTGYNRMARPVLLPNETVQVEISMKITQLELLDTKSQVITVLGWVTTLWEDPRLRWNASEYGGLDYIALPPASAWVPTFVLANTAASTVYDEFWYSLFKLKVWSDGRILWTPGGVFTAECKMDMFLFPFDDQVCFFKFANWVYDGQKVNLTYTAKAEEEVLEYYPGTDAQWDITGTKVIRNDVYFSPSPIPLPEVFFGLHFQRKSLYYSVNVVLLSIFLMVLVLLMFLLPAESGERISMGVTLLLAYSVFILIVNDHIPPVSTTVPIIIIYLLCFMGVTCLGITESIIVLYCYHHNGEKPPPCWNFSFRNTESYAKEATDFNSVEMEPNRNWKLDRPYSANHLIPRYNAKTVELEAKASRSHIKQNGHADNWKHIDEHSQASMKTLISDKTIEENKKKWQDLSRRLDMIFFTVSMVLFVITAILILVVIPQVVDKKDIAVASTIWK